MKFLILTNHSYMLWHFRLPLLQELQKRGEVVLSMPFVGHEDDFQNAGFRCTVLPVQLYALDSQPDSQQDRNNSQGEADDICKGINRSEYEVGKVTDGQYGERQGTFPALFLLFLLDILLNRAFCRTPCGFLC